MQAKCVALATLYRLKAIVSISRFDFRNTTFTLCTTMYLLGISSTAARTLVKARIAHDKIVYFIMFSNAVVYEAIATTAVFTEGTKIRNEWAVQEQRNSRRREEILWDRVDNPLAGFQYLSCPFLYRGIFFFLLISFHLVIDHHHPQ